jgi:hypothetical protein
MVRRIIAAAVGVFSPSKKVIRRRLLPVLKLGQEHFVIEIVNDAEGLDLPPKRHASSALVALFRGTKDTPGPLPLFNKATNIIDQVSSVQQLRSAKFVSDHVEYDVVVFHLCTYLGQPDKSMQLDEMEKHGFTLTSIHNHQHTNEIKNVLSID